MKQHHLVTMVGLAIITSCVATYRIRYFRMAGVENEGVWKIHRTRDGVRLGNGILALRIHTGYDTGRQVAGLVVPLIPMRKPLGDRQNSDYGIFIESGYYKQAECGKCTMKYGAAQVVLPDGRVIKPAEIKPVAPDAGLTDNSPLVCNAGVVSRSVYYRFNLSPKELKSYKFVLPTIHCGAEESMPVLIFENSSNTIVNVGG